MPSTPDPRPLEAALARSRIAVLGLIACTGIVLFTLEPGSEDVLPRQQTGLALALALGSIVARHVSSLRGISGATAVAAAIASWLFAIGIASVGVYLGFSLGARQPGVLLALGAFILALPKPRIAALES